MSKSSDYWRKREEEWEKEYEQRQAYWDSQIWTIYKQLQEDMQAEIDGWYMRYASKEGLTMAQAQQAISKADQDYYARRAAELVRLAQEDMDKGSSENAKIYFSETANQEMRLYNAAMKVNRMQLIQSMLDLQVAKASGKVHTEMEKALIERAQQVYRNNAKILGPTVIGNIKRIPELINSSFHGATFSERIWNNHAPSLARNVQNTLARLLVMGESPSRFRSQLVQDSKLKTKAAYKAAGRLLNTEAARVQTQAMVSTIKDIGFTQYEFISGAKCCPHCQELDGKILDLKGSSYGTDMPPMHPSCRCSIAPYSDRKEYEEWLDAYAETGQEYTEWLDEKENGPTKYTEKDIPALEKEVQKYQKWLLMDGDPKNYDAAKGEKAAAELKRLQEERWERLTYVPDFYSMRIKDIQKWISNNCHAEFVYQTKPSKEVLHETAKAIRLVEAKIGGGIPDLKIVFGAKGLAGWGAAAYDPLNKRITIPANLKGGLAEFNKRRREWSEKDGKDGIPQIAAQDFLGLILHELGHAVDFATNNELQKMFFNRTEPKDNNGKALLESLSVYARNTGLRLDRSEAIAEAFSAYLDPSKERLSKVPIKVRQAFDKVLKSIGDKKASSATATWTGNSEGVKASKMPRKLDKYRIKDTQARKKLIKKCVSEKRAVFCTDGLAKNSKNIPRLSGYFDVVCHGHPNFVTLFDKVADVETLCASIAQREDYRKGTPIRLISCSAGASDDGVAAYLAKKLGVEILAASDTVWVYPSGKITVGTSAKMNDGHWRKFVYNKEKDTVEVIKIDGD